MSNKTTIVIPARYGSTRFPGKLLSDLEGKPVVQWVYEKAMASKADEVWIATDDEKIMNAVKKFGGKAVITSPDHPSGTDRIWEAVQKISPSNDDELIINLQGDEPLLPPDVIDQLIDMMQADPSLEMGTVAVSANREEISNDPNRVKVVKGSASSKALYFTRAAAPFLRDGGEDCGMLLHWGIYAYRKSTLSKIVKLPESSLEKCEKLEQLRALEAGISIHVLTTDKSTVGIDTPEDLEIVRKILKNQ